MGKVVTFSSLPYKDIGAGAKAAPITGKDGREMQADILRLAPGAKLSDEVPRGSDRYFFTLSGEASIAGNGATHTLRQDTFATVQEAVQFTLTNTGNAEAEVLSVFAPPAGEKKAHAGFAGGIAVAHRSAPPVVSIPEQKKRRIFFVDKSAAASDRGHAMIVLYEPETVTKLHRHPNAESMFVVLTGKVRFTVNGQDVVIERGQAAHFPASDVHGLRGAEGDVSFLEFHIPAKFTTEYV
ncbi:MAG TPA: cupin domain-containing protein [Burkholderiales bacterium]|nr:cupin domain-containing protein [Burkholderiales bacterium]